MLDLPQLPLIFTKICIFVLFESHFMTHNGHPCLISGDLLGIIRRLSQKVDPLQHPAFPNRKKLDLLHEQRLFIFRNRLCQPPLLRFQAIKKESLKLSRGNCFLIPWRPTGTVLVPGLCTALSLFRTFVFLIRAFVFPLMCGLPSADRSLRQI